jgi:arylformamidase
MKIYDVSLTISTKIPIYPGDPKVEIKPVSRISQGDGANVSLICLGSHTGTHVDPPFHFVESGLTIDQIPLELLVGDCFVLSLGDVSAVRVEHLEAADIPRNTERLLLKTRNSLLLKEPVFHRNFTYLEPDAADWLVKHGIKLVGVDYLSIEQFQSKNHETHLRLLKSGVVILEGLDLSEVVEGIYTLVCLPIKIAGGDGAPARVILIQQN